MVMLTGEYRHSLDSKNRLIIPAKFREGLQDTFYITKGDDGCLNIYTEEMFQSKLSKLASIPSTKAEQRAVIRQLTANAIDCSLDNQGRVQLTPAIKKKAGLDKNIVIIGAYDHIEIWPEDIWDAYDERTAESFESASEELTSYLTNQVK